MARALALADAIDAFAVRMGRASAWLALAMVVAVLALVLLRYMFGVGAVWLREGAAYAHAMLFLGAAAWTLQQDGHIRVDIFYAEARPRTKALIDLCGAVFLLLPFLLVLGWLSLPYVARSWAILEGSREAGGLPAVFALKTLLLAFCGLFALQGLAQALRAATVLARGNEADDRR